MVRVVAVPGACVFLAAALPASVAVADDTPIRPRLLNCEPRMEKPDPIPGVGDAFRKGYEGVGYHQTNDSHYMRVNLAFYINKSTGQSLDDALTKVKRIYLCRSKGNKPNNDVMTCPTSESYVIYDKANGINRIGSDRVLDWDTSGKDQRVPGDEAASTELKDLDWRNSADADVAIVLRMQLESDPPVPTMTEKDFSDDATKYGACSNWSITSTNPAGAQILVCSPTKVVRGTSADTRYDICDLEGKKRWWGAGDKTQSQCISSDVAEYIRLWMRELDSAQVNRLQQPLAEEGKGKPGEEERKISWRNGRDPNPSDPNNPYLPSFVFVGPGIGLDLAWATRGGPRIAQHTYARINASALNDVRKAFGDKESWQAISMTFHEYFHRLQWTWNRESDMPNWPGAYIQESMASADALNDCLSGFPGTASSPNAMDRLCMNAGKLGMFDHEAHYDYRGHQQNPTKDLITATDSGIFWRYLYEQFSYPVGTTAHPSGDRSLIIHESKLLNERYSDEGADLVGYLFEGFAKAKNENATALSAADVVLREKLGRSLDDLVQDFHTALYLKDYKDTDPRWRFEWTHADGYAATRLLSAGKPFEVPDDVYGRTCGADGICDGLQRTHRVLDSWKARGARRLMRSTESMASSSATVLGVYGTEAASVSPDESWAGKAMRVRVWDRPGENVRFRLFHMVQTGGVPVPIPQGTPTPITDPVTMRETYDWSVPIQQGTDELLVIASAGAQGGSFEYEFVSVPSLEILSPVASNQAFIGSPLSVTGRRPFVMALSIKDALGNAVFITNKSELTIEIPGCAASSCKLGDSDYTVIPASGGNLMLVVTVPAAFYPSTTGEGSYDLKATYAGASDITTKVLKYSNKAEQLAATLLLDASGSMAGTKMQALKSVAKGLIGSLVPAETGAPKPLVSLVTFNWDASTWFPLKEMDLISRLLLEAQIDALAAGWGTAIGDGLYEAQSGLAAKFDPSNDHPARELVLLLTDGVNSQPAGPETYYATNPRPPSIPTGDGNGEWYKDKPLYYHDRVSQKLKVPTLSVVGIGQDADLTALDKITRLSGQHPLFVKGPESNPSASPNQVTLDMADGMFGALEGALDYSRVSSGRITGPAETPDPNDPPNEFNIEVEPGVSELRVSVTSGRHYGGLGGLFRPNEENVEEPVTAESEDKSSRSYRIANPPAGTWKFVSYADYGSEPDVFVSAAVLGSLKLFTFADAHFLTAKNEVLAGSPVVLRAVGIDGGRVATSCALLTASVTAPGGTEPSEVWLADDSKHDDGEAGDGVFGGLYRTTSTTGIYDVTFRAACRSPITEAWVLREQRSGFVVQLRDEDDADKDGMPTAVEKLCLKPYDPNDTELDFDGDGLTNLREVQLGTSPCRSDTDGGGLSDGSEIAAGLDPFDPSDDNMTAPLPELTPGNTKIHIHSGIIVGTATLEIETAPETSGPWSPVSDAWIPGQNQAIHSGLINGTLYCYRLRLAVGGRASAWSYPLCATPNGDATPPTISVVRGIEACGASYVQPELAFYDSPYPYDSWNKSIDLGLSSTGVVAMRIWEGVGPAPDTAVWMAPNTKPVIKTPTDASTISIQVMDGAGNLSRVAMLSVTCVQPECFFKPKDIGCCTDVSSCGRAREYALFSESQLYVGDAVKLKNLSGTAVPIANKGSGQTYIGVEALAGSVASFGPVDLRDRSRVEGAIECGANVAFGNGVVVTGGTVQSSAALQLPSLAKFSVKFPAAGGDVYLNPSQVKSLAPGSYGSITVNRDAELQLSTGTYFINYLTLESMSRLKVSSTNGPVYLYIKSGLNYRGTVTDTTGSYDRLFWGYFGSTPASVEGPLVGTIVSPTAAVSLKTVSGTTHRGAVFAKELDIQARALFVHYPFIGTWNAPTGF